MSSFSKQNILLNREFYQLSNDVYTTMIWKEFLSELVNSTPILTLNLSGIHRSQSFKLQWLKMNK